MNFTWKDKLAQQVERLLCLWLYPLLHKIDKFKLRIVFCGGWGMLYACPHMDRTFDWSP